MKRIFIVVLTILVSQIFAQNETEFEFDYAQFKNDSTTNVLEIYYLIYNNQLDKPLNIKDELIMHIQMENMLNNELIINKDWILSNGNNGSLEQEKQINLLGSVAFIVKNGKYKFNISIRNGDNSENLKEFSEIINVRSFNNQKFSVSEIELATRIITENANKNSIFYKNTLEVFPNPSIVYSKESPVLFYYSELYGLEYCKSENINLDISIYNKNNQSVYKKEKTVKKKNTSIVEIGVINLQKYPTDTYTLAIAMEDPLSKESVISAKKFYFVNPGVAEITQNTNQELSFLSSEFGVISEEECDDLFLKSKIIASSDEIDKYNVLDSLNQKREFLYKFWRKRDDIPLTSVNEFKNNFMKRIDIANSRFKTMSSAGYNTDRGRIFLRLGEPDEIDRHPNETYTKPYEIWSYHTIEGGVYFIFGDVTGFNYYQLLHSTMRGELQDPDWERRIRTN